MKKSARFTHPSPTPEKEGSLSFDSIPCQLHHYHTLPITTTFSFCIFSLSLAYFKQTQVSPILCKIQNLLHCPVCPSRSICIPLFLSDQTNIHSSHFPTPFTPLFSPPLFQRTSVNIFVFLLVLLALPLSRVDPPQLFCKFIETHIHTHVQVIIIWQYT